ncbi:MAG: 1-acyl-sn-glycerol-3-phosphate acyltransferase [Endomicrobia bacterium]|nr:1-acyl-sn-glycerol-3-phosphate acyltransferase [Endomicrobiia bacterium]
MADFLKKIYGVFVTLQASTWLLITGVAAYFYFFAAGYKDKENRLRSFLYFQGKVIQAAITCASGFNKKIIKYPMPDKPSILVSNHTSMCDSFVFCSFNIKNFVCVSKGWPFNIPLYGKFIKYAGYINSKNKTAAEIIEIAKEKLKQGLHVVIFPEGTRQKKTGRFRSLAFAAAIAADTYVVPFAVKGLDKMIPAGKYTLTPAPVEYVQMPAVKASDFSFEVGHLKMARYVKDMIVREIERKNIIGKA